MPTNSDEKRYREKEDLRDARNANDSNFRLGISERCNLVGCNCESASVGKWPLSAKRRYTDVPDDDSEDDDSENDDRNDEEYKLPRVYVQYTFVAL